MKARWPFWRNRAPGRFCLPPELPFASVEALAAAGRQSGVGIEVWAYGRMPLAMSGRCYHARVHGLDQGFLPVRLRARIPDGLTVRTLDGKDFLAINGVQTLSHNYCNLIGSLDRLAAGGRNLAAPVAA